MSATPSRTKTLALRDDPQRQPTSAAGALERLPAVLQDPIAEAAACLSLGGGSHQVAAAQILITTALGLLDRVVAETPDAIGRDTIHRLRRLAGGTVAPTRTDDLDGWQLRLRQVEGLDG